MADNVTEVAENETVIPVDAPETTETQKETTASFSQADVDAIVAKRLGEDRNKLRAEMETYQREIAARDAFIAGLQQRETKEEDPLESLTAEEKMLARANAAAVAPLQKQFQQFQNQVAALVAPLAMKEQAEDFFSTKGPTIPDFVKKRSLSILKQGAARGITLEGAYKLACADYAEMSFSGQLPSPEIAPAPKKAVVPHTELGGGSRTLAAKPTAKEMSWAEFREAAEKVLKYAPIPGARAGDYGVAGYNGEEID